MIVLPAILPEDIDDLASHLHRVKNLVRSVQIDACDGRLTGSASWPYSGNRGEFEEILSQQDGLPLWDKFDFEIDLMVLNPSREFERWIDAGASRIIVHYGGNIEKIKDIFKAMKERGVGAGLALHLDQPIEALDDYAADIEVVQLMGIRRIGFQGEPFDAEVVERIKAIRKKYPELPISVDGGVNVGSAALLAAAGATQLIVGSALFDSDDIGEAFRFFEAL